LIILFLSSRTNVRNLSPSPNDTPSQRLKERFLLEPVLSIVEGVEITEAK
jgi:hypothetical protein